MSDGLTAGNPEMVAPDLFHTLWRWECTQVKRNFVQRVALVGRGLKNYPDDEAPASVARRALALGVATTYIRLLALLTLSLPVLVFVQFWVFGRDSSLTPITLVGIGVALSVVATAALRIYRVHRYFTGPDWGLEGSTFRATRLKPYGSPPEEFGPLGGTGGYWTAHVSGHAASGDDSDPRQDTPLGPNDKVIRFFADDYSGIALWYGGATDTDSWRLPKDLVSDIEQWLRDWESTLGAGDDDPTLDVRGPVLASRVQEALGGDWKVIYEPCD